MTVCQGGKLSNTCRCKSCGGPSYVSCQVCDDYTAEQAEKHRNGQPAVDLRNLNYRAVPQAEPPPNGPPATN